MDSCAARLGVEAESGQVLAKRPNAAKAPRPMERGLAHICGEKIAETKTVRNYQGNTLSLLVALRSSQL